MTSEVCCCFELLLSLQHGWEVWNAVCVCVCLQRERVCGKLPASCTLSSVGVFSLG